jgi:capsular polysaccharide biosynthesis protein
MEGERVKAEQDEPTESHGIRSTIAVVWRRRKLIGAVTFAFAFVTAVLSLVMPRIYVAHTSLLPPVSSAPGMMSAPGLESSLSLLGIRDESAATAKLFQQILDSRVVMEEVIRKQNLLEYFRLTRHPERFAYEQAVLLLRADTDFGVSDAGLIEIAVRFATPWFAGPKEDERVRRLAADVANAFVEQLDLVNREKSLSRAKQTRVYLERQIAENVEAIRKMGAELAEFQRAHGAVALDFQTRALVENAAKLKADLLAKEVELGVAEQTMTSENPVIESLRAEVRQLRAGLTSLQGSSVQGVTRAPQVDLPASEIPQLQLRLADFERDLQAQMILQTYLNQQFYQAKIQEARDAPTVQVLDPAVPPVERSSPKRKLMLVGAVVSGAIIGILAAAILEGFGPSRRDQAGVRA